MPTHSGLQLTDDVLAGLCAVSEAVEAGVEASVSAFLMLADACVRAGDIPARDGVLERAVSWTSAATGSLADDIGDRWVAYVRIGHAAEAVRRPALARRAYTTALERASAATAPDVVAMLWREIGDTWRTEGDAGRARSAYRAAVALVGRDEFAQDVLVKLADAERKWGTHEEAECAFSEALAILDRRRRDRKLDAETAARDALRLGEAAMSLRLPDLARESCVFGRDQLDPAANPNLLGELWHRIGAACSAAGDSVPALEAYRAAAACAVVGMNRVVLLCSLIEAELSWGTSDRAAHAVSDALQILLTSAEGTAVDRKVLAENARLLVPLADTLDDPDLAYRAHALARRLGPAVDARATP